MSVALSWVLVGLILAAMWHFLYDGIIAPSIRLHMRYSVFALRDELRREMTVDNSESLLILQSAMNISLRVMSEFSISDAFMLKRYLAENPEVRDEVLRRSKVVESCTNQKVQDISKRLNRVLRAAFVVNTGGWAIYIVPLIVALALFRKIKSITISMLNLPEVPSQIGLKHSSSFCH
ncbi:MAG: hypothetical protein U0930_04780 [Pirellulales bacterium]